MNTRRTLSSLKPLVWGSNLGRAHWLLVLGWAALSLEVSSSGKAARAQEEGNLVELAGLKSRTPRHWMATTWPLIWRFAS